MLGEITPVLITFNEAVNIGRTLSRLGWAKDIVIVDSGSTDETISILKGFPQVRVFHRAFDTHGNQWRYATQETGIRTKWILRLDADYEVTQALIAELSALDADAPVTGYRIAFDYAIFGRKLITSLYPPNTVLLRIGRFSVLDRGHTEIWTVQGSVRNLKARIIHDDRKAVEQWMVSQSCYMRRELEYVKEEHSGLLAWLQASSPTYADFATFLYCLFAKGLILNGRAGVFYALQRSTAEAALSLMVIEESFREENGRHSASRQLRCRACNRILFDHSWSQRFPRGFAAAIVRDGLIAAAEEERFRRVKHWAGFPTQAIEYCLREAKVDLSDVDHVAVNQDSRANIVRKLGYLLSHRPDPALVIARWRNRQHRAGILDLLSASVSRQELARHAAQDRASSCAFILGLPRVARSRRPSLYRSTVLAIFPARLGVLEPGPIFQLRSGSTFRTRSECFTRRSRSISGFRTMATNTR